MHEIEVPATILAVLSGGAYRAKLANGHECIGRAAKGVKEIHAPGDRVRLAFSPADLSRARILTAETKG
jgi:translation initiation factor IF-1